MTKVDYKALIKADLEKGFTKTQLEKLIGLPKNNLSYTLVSDRGFSKISMLKIDKWEASEKPNPLDLVLPKKASVKNGRNNTLENAARGRDKNGVNNDEVEKDVDAKSILKEIKAIESEKIPAERNTSLGRKVWQKEQINRISELKSKLK